MSKFKTKEAETMGETQAGKFTTSKKVNLYFFLPEFIATNIATWKYHVDECNNDRYDMFLVRYLLTILGLDLKFF